MAAAEGEERLVTLFGDVHYYFSEPSPRPAHHRFDKESYIYLYRHVAKRRGRIEIANHAGTPEQDAFTGHLSNARIIQSQRQPALVTIVVDGLGGSSGSQQNEHDWRLPSTDPRDEGNYLFRLHTLDIYFWTAEDARSFLAHLQTTLSSRHIQADALASTPAPATGAMSPVVQNLEHVAISDPAYHRSSVAGSRSGSTAAPAPSGTPATTATAATSPPPTAAAAAAAPANPAAFAPLAYNPAAPPAPEEIKHREKTPPPPDAAAGGTGLAAAAAADHAPPGFHGVPPPPPPGGPLSPASPFSQHASGASSPPASQRYVPTVAPDGRAYTPSAPPSGAAAAALDSPTVEILGAGYTGGGARQPVAHLQPQYMDYLSSRPAPASPPHRDGSHHRHHDHHGEHRASQSSQGGSSQHGTGDWAMHGQVYVPGDGEEAGWGGGHGGRHESRSSQPPGKLEQRAEKVEKGFNRLLRKVEKKIG